MAQRQAANLAGRSCATSLREGFPHLAGRQGCNKSAGASAPQLQVSKLVVRRQPLEHARLPARCVQVGSTVEGVVLRRLPMAWAEEQAFLHCGPVGSTVGVWCCAGCLCLLESEEEGRTLAASPEEVDATSRDAEHWRRLGGRPSAAGKKSCQPLHRGGSMRAGRKGAGECRHCIQGVQKGERAGEPTRRPKFAMPAGHAVPGARQVPLRWVHRAKWQCALLIPACAPIELGTHTHSRHLRSTAPL